MHGPGTSFSVFGPLYFLSFPLLLVSAHISAFCLFSLPPREFPFVLSPTPTPVSLGLPLSAFSLPSKPPTETQSHPRTLPPPTATSRLITLLISAIAFSSLHHPPCLRPRSSPSRRSPPTTPRRICTWSFTTRFTTAAASSMSTRMSLPLFSLLNKSRSPRERLATGCFSYRESLPLSQSLTANLASSGLPLDHSPHSTINLTNG